jgi:hypothetical protein
MHLDAAAEWHPTRNSGLEPTDLRPASNKKVWWQCSEGHQWQVSPSNRQRGERCPECAEIQRSLTRLPELVGTRIGKFVV